MASFGGELAHHEILGQIILQPVEAADGFERSAACRDGRAHGEAHAFQHPGDQNAGQEIGIHPDRFQTRPEAASSDRTIRASRDAQLGILKLGGDRPKQ